MENDNSNNNNKKKKKNKWKLDLSANLRNLCTRVKILVLNKFTELCLVREDFREHGPFEDVVFSTTKLRKFHCYVGLREGITWNPKSL